MAATSSTTSSPPATAGSSTNTVSLDTLGCSPETRAFLGNLVPIISDWNKKNLNVCLMHKQIKGRNVFFFGEHHEICKDMRHLIEKGASRKLWQIFSEEMPTDSRALLVHLTNIKVCPGYGYGLDSPYMKLLYVLVAAAAEKYKADQEGLEADPYLLEAAFQSIAFEYFSNKNFRIVWERVKTSLKDEELLPLLDGNLQLAVAAMDTTMLIALVLNMVKPYLQSLPARFFQTFALELLKEGHLEKEDETLIQSFLKKMDYKNFASVSTRINTIREKAMATHFVRGFNSTSSIAHLDTFVVVGSSHLPSLVFAIDAEINSLESESSSSSASSSSAAASTSSSSTSSSAASSSSSSAAASSTSSPAPSSSSAATSSSSSPGT